MKLAARLFAAFLCALLPALAWAQTPIVAGPWTPGHVPMFVGAGSFQPVIQDSGPAAGGPAGLGLSELMLQARGTGTPPYIGQGSGPFGTNACDYDAPTNNATGYHFLCWSAYAGSGGLIAYGAVGAASQLPLNFNINGTIYSFPFAVSGIIGPNVSVVNDYACWNNLTGSLLQDCGAKITTPATTAVGDIPCWNNTTGKALSDCGVRLLANATVYVDASAGNDVVGCGTATLASACRTLAYIGAQIHNRYDLAGYQLTIQAADGNYSTWVNSGAWAGGGTVVLQGNTSNINGVIVNGAGGNCIVEDSFAQLTVQWLQVTNCSVGVGATLGHATLSFHHINFNSSLAGGISIYASRQSYVEIIGGGNLISALGAYFIEVSHQGNLRAAQTATGSTVFTLMANVTATSGAWAYSSSLGDITFTLYTSSPFALNSFTASGIKWLADAGGEFQDINGSTGVSLTPAFFPGSSPGYCQGVCEVDQQGHGVAVPTTVSGCGGGAGIIGNDYYGQVTESGSNTSCSVVFASAFAQAPYCQVTWGTTPTPASVYATASLSTLGVVHSAETNAMFTYSCQGF